ncbi:hypothetical protein [Flavobacterium sp.]|uniref:hypothetical protein n=1 Tax=Flavobacterium sp. TaxID=239 RepID=UPI003B9B3C83
MNIFARFSVTIFRVKDYLAVNSAVASGEAAAPDERGATAESLTARTHKHLPTHYFRAGTPKKERKSK